MRGLLCLVLAACTAAERPAPPAPSATFVVEQVFGPRFFDAAARAELVLPAVDLRLPDLIERDRYRFLQVTELRRVTDEKRVGEVAFAIDGWPAQLGVEVTHTSAGWRLSAVDAARVQQGIVEVLGIHGLPRSKAAEPWPGGLAGRDAAGRPTAAALVMVTSAGLWIDGQPVADQREAVRSALVQALTARQQLAWAANATYRPQVAIALPATEPATRLPQLTTWAAEVGAEALLLIVRDPQGGPAFLPLARLADAPEGEVVRPAAVVVGGPEGVLRVTSEGAGAGEGLDALPPDPPGLILVPGADASHAWTVAQLDDIRRRLPRLPVALRSP